MPDQPITPFDQWIRDQADGVACDEITAALAEVVQAVAQHNKKGKLVITIDVEPGGSHGRQVLTFVEATPKPPLPDPEGSVFYVGAGGGLFRDDPSYAHRTTDS